MNKRKARRLIKELQSELTSTTVTQQFWMDKVQAYVQLIFGNNKHSIALPMFGTYYNDRYYNVLASDHAIKAKVVAQKLEELFKTYQNMISNSVFLRRNFFSNDTNGTIISVLIFIGGIIWGIAYIEGVRSSNFEKANLQNEIKMLRDSLISKPIYSK